jgi:deoxyribodipyrimidine photo-lyase
MTPRQAPLLLWFRQDLRLRDNPALHDALQSGAPILPVYIVDTKAEGAWPSGAASRWWLYHSLSALEESLRKRGSRLLFAKGYAGEILGRLAVQTGARAVYWNRRYEPAERAHDLRIQRDLAAAGIAVKTFNATLLHEPEAVSNKQGRPFQIFTPFWRHCLTLKVSPPIHSVPRTLRSPPEWPRSMTLTELGVALPTETAGGQWQTWQPGESAALKRLAAFVARPIDDYDEARNFPATDGTSLLSAPLHFGEISPRQIWDVVKKRSEESGVFPSSKGAQVFLKEVGWREFAYHLLHHFPTAPDQPLRSTFQNFPWARDPGGRKLRAWQDGLTGYPLVDAGMRQLRATGWMHNRLRMICGSFLVKDLRLSWTHGARWFWDTLIDADLANNTLGWQWVAGCGTDASPYFRIFSPERQSRKFDPSGEYIRRWVPELARLSADDIHAPATVPAATLRTGGVKLGENYPRPIVDHAEAQVQALAAFKSMRRWSASQNVQIPKSSVGGA